MTAFDDLETAVRDAVDVRLFTVLAWIPDGRLLRRVHSRHPREYRCVDEARPYLGADRTAVRTVFTDHALIESLGCGAVVNAPVLDGGRVVGVLNVLGPEGNYDEETVAVVVALDPVAIPGLVARFGAGTGADASR